MNSRPTGAKTQGSATSSCVNEGLELLAEGLRLRLRGRKSGVDVDGGALTSVPEASVSLKPLFEDTRVGCKVMEELREMR